MAFFSFVEASYGTTNLTAGPTAAQKTALILLVLDWTTGKRFTLESVTVQGWRGDGANLLKFEVYKGTIFQNKNSFDVLQLQKGRRRAIFCSFNQSVGRSCGCFDWTFLSICRIHRSFIFLVNLWKKWVNVSWDTVEPFLILRSLKLYAIAYGIDKIFEIKMQSNQNISSCKLLLSLSLNQIWLKCLKWDAIVPNKTL